jgi:hypothetical protein
MSGQRDALCRGSRWPCTRDVKRAASDGNLETGGKGIVTPGSFHATPNASPAQFRKTWPSGQR